MSKLNLSRDRYGGESGTFAQEYADKLMTEHSGKDVLDHPDGSVTTEKLGKGAVTEDKLADGAVTAKKLGIDVQNKLDGMVSSVSGKTGEVSLVKSDIAGLDEALDNKVDKEPGKVLSSYDYTAGEKEKLAGIENGAQRNTVLSVAGKTDKVTLNKSDVGLDKVDNTADMNKPISYMMQAALDGKANSSHTHLTTDIQAVIPPTPIKRHLFNSLETSGATIISGNPVTGAGETGTAIQFDGSSSVGIPVAIRGLSTYTISFKIKTSQETTGADWLNGIGILDADKGGYKNDFGFVLVNGGYLQYCEGELNTDSDKVYVKTTSPINDGQWHRITLTRGGGVASMYVDDIYNNKAACSTTARDAYESGDFCEIGCKRKSAEHPGQYFRGMIDDIRFYNIIAPPMESLAEVAKTGIYQDLENWMDLKKYIDGVAGGGASAFNSQYDYVINYQKDFDAMIASDTWLGATHILFNTDVEVSFKAYDDTVIIPPTVKLIDGNSHTLKINNSYGGGGYTLFKFNSKPADFSMGHLNIESELTGEHACYLFYNLINIHDCTVSVAAKKNQTDLPLYSAFYNCDNLTNVKTVVDCPTWTSSGETRYVYQGCTNLLRCSAHVDNAKNMYMYYQCANLNECEGTIGDEYAAGMFMVYTVCKKMVNCTGTCRLFHPDSFGYVYYSNSDITNCEAVIEVETTYMGGDFYARGFFGNTGLVNCSVSTKNVPNNASGSVMGFYSNYYLNGCRKGSEFVGILWAGSITNRDDDSCDLV